MRTKTTWFLMLLGSLLSRGLGYAASGSQRANCDDNAACFQRADSARQLSKAGRLEEALVVYKEAYQLVADPKLLFNIARVSHKLEQFAGAVTAYRSYLAAGAEDSPEQKRKAQEYLLEAEQQASAPAMVGAPRQEDSQPPEKTAATAATEPAGPANSAPLATGARRPTWRLVTGGVLLGSSGLLMGFGISALLANNTCVEDSLDPMSCSPYRNTLDIGSGLLATGAALAVTGGILLAIPGRHSGAHDVLHKKLAYEGLGVSSCGSGAWRSSVEPCVACEAKFPVP